MLFLKLIQQLVKALNSDGTPGQVAAGIALGAVFGLTPLMNLHNLVLFGCALIFYVSMPGMVTFKNAGLAAEVAGKVSVEHFLLETDSPYLAPVPHRGKRNEPSHIPIIAAKIAQLQHLSPDDVARATNYNVYKLFGIGQPGAPQFSYKLKNSLYINLTIRCNADWVARGSRSRGRGRRSRGERRTR